MTHHSCEQYLPRSCRHASDGRRRRCASGYTGTSPSQHRPHLQPREALRRGSSNPRASALIARDLPRRTGSAAMARCTCLVHRLYCGRVGLLQPALRAREEAARLLVQGLHESVRQDSEALAGPCNLNVPLVAAAPGEPFPWCLLQPGGQPGLLLHAGKVQFAPTNLKGDGQLGLHLDTTLHGLRTCRCVCRQYYTNLR